MAAAPLDAVASTFGEMIAASVAEAPVGKWTGPVRSSYGVHLLRVERRTPGRVSAFEETRNEVLRDWLEEQREGAWDEYIERLRVKYQLRVEASGAAAK